MEPKTAEDCYRTLQ